jgi:hypothetical protein
MKRNKNIEDKAIRPEAIGEQVKIKIRPGLAVEGVGKDGQVVMVDAATAERLIKIGYAIKIKEN